MDEEQFQEKWRQRKEGYKDIIRQEKKDLEYIKKEYKGFMDMALNYE